MMKSAEEEADDISILEGSNCILVENGSSFADSSDSSVRGMMALSSSLGTKLPTAPGRTFETPGNSAATTAEGIGMGGRAAAATHVEEALPPEFLQRTDELPVSAMVPVPKEEDERPHSGSVVPLLQTNPGSTMPDEEEVKTTKARCKPPPIDPTLNFMMADREDWSGWKGTPVENKRQSGKTRRAQGKLAKRQSGKYTTGHNKHSSPTHHSFPAKEELHTSSLRVVIRQTNEDDWSRYDCMLFCINAGTSPHVVFISCSACHESQGSFSPMSWQQHTETFSVRIEAGPEDVVGYGETSEKGGVVEMPERATQLEINVPRIIKVGKYKNAGQSESMGGGGHVSSSTFVESVSNNEDESCPTLGLPLREMSANDSFTSVQLEVRDHGHRVSLPQLGGASSQRFDFVPLKTASRTVSTTFLRKSVQPRYRS
jgi:hypothetical protein